MLDDVPNHFVRDCLVDYVEDQLREDTREKVLAAVFSDLSSTEISEYVSCIKMKKRDVEDEEKRERKAAVQVRIDQLKRSGGPRLHKALAAIDDTIDLAPCPAFGIRDYHQRWPICRSVLIPDSHVRDIFERGIMPGPDIDQNGDQIRARIKIFLQTEWTVQEFAKSLEIAPGQITNFLEKKGPRGGTQSLAFQLAWEFFKRRELVTDFLEAPYEESEPATDEVSVREVEGDAVQEPKARAARRALPTNISPRKRPATSEKVALRRSKRIKSTP
jgi:hypothetical protein